MPVNPRRWTLSAAAALAGVTRAQARSLADDGLVSRADLSLAEVVLLRAATLTRPLLFPGETQPANSAREVRVREHETAAKTRMLLGTTPDRDAAVLVYQHDVVAAVDHREFLAAVMDRAREGQPYLIVPIGAWWHELVDQVGATPRPVLRAVGQTPTER